MSAELALPPMSVEDFYDWADGREGKYELERGLVLAMAPERVLHARLKAAIYSSLARAIEASKRRCEAFTDSIAVRIDSTTSYVPDVVVQCGARLGGDERETRDAVIVVEVLSPSTAYRDATAKLSGYFRVPAVHHYLIVDGDRRLVIHHRRDRGELIATRIVTEGILEFEPPSLSVDVEEWLPQEGADG